MPKAKASSSKSRARAAKSASGAADPVQHVIDCALALAAERGWRRTSLADVAHAADLSLAELYRLFPSKSAILAAFVERIDRAMLAGGPAEGEHARDRLFDILMRRFEALGPHKAGIEAILRQPGAHPVAALCGMRRLMRSMAWALEAAGIPARGAIGAARTKSLAALYFAILRVWLGDETPDLSRTMAALDKGLTRLQKIAEMMRSLSRPFGAGRSTRAAA